jgi:hypothetical protein
LQTLDDKTPEKARATGDYNFSVRKDFVYFHSSLGISNLNGPAPISRASGSR